MFVQKERLCNVTNPIAKGRLWLWAIVTDPACFQCPTKRPNLVARATFSKAHALGSQNRKKDKNQEIRGYIEKSKEREERYRSSIYLAGGLFDNITGTLGEYKCFAFKIYIVVVVVVVVISYV